jgi:hypothetical protein
MDHFSKLYLKKAAQTSSAVQTAQIMAKLLAAPEGRMILGGGSAQGNGDAPPKAGDMTDKELREQRRLLPEVYTRLSAEEILTLHRDGADTVFSEEMHAMFKVVAKWINENMDKFGERFACNGLDPLTHQRQLNDLIQRKITNKLRKNFIEMGMRGHYQSSEMMHRAVSCVRQYQILIQDLPPELDLGPGQYRVYPVSRISEENKGFVLCVVIGGSSELESSLDPFQYTLGLFTGDNVEPDGEIMLHVPRCGHVTPVYTRYSNVLTLDALKVLLRQGVDTAVEICERVQSGWVGFHLPRVDAALESHPLPELLREFVCRNPDFRLDADGVRDFAALVSVPDEDGAELIMAQYRDLMSWDIGALRAEGYPQTTDELLEADAFHALFVDASANNGALEGLGSDLILENRDPRQVIRKLERYARRICRVSGISLAIPLLNPDTREEEASDHEDLIVCLDEDNGDDNDEAGDAADDIFYTDEEMAAIRKAEGEVRAFKTFEAAVLANLV